MRYSCTLGLVFALSFAICSEGVRLKRNDRHNVAVGLRQYNEEPSFVEKEAGEGQAAKEPSLVQEEVQDEEVDDGNDEAEEMGSQEHEAPARLREAPVVHGHHALGSLRVFGVRPAADGRCHNILSKIESLFENHEELGREDGAERKAHEDMDAGRRGHQPLAEIQDAIGRSDLGSGLAAGAVVTTSDMNELVECELGDGSQVRLEEHNVTASGEEIVQGDMVMPKEEAALLQLKDAVQQGLRWAGPTFPKGIIPWCSAPGTKSAAIKAWKQAIAHVESQTCLSFHEVDSKSEWTCERLPEMPDTPAIMLQSAEPRKCWGRIGMVGNPKVNLGEGCWTMGVAIHELCHAIGMAHEQSRQDRDKHVIVHWDNIPRDQYKDFDVWNYGAYKASTLDRYDFLSVMHYGDKTFAIDRSKDTLEAKTGWFNTRMMGQRLGLSSQDAEQIRKMYNCPNVVWGRNKLCPSFATSATPNSNGDCACGTGICYDSANNRKGCPSSGGVSTRFFNPKCETCVCRSQAIRESATWYLCKSANMHTCGGSCCCDEGYDYDYRQKKCRSV